MAIGTRPAVLDPPPLEVGWSRNVRLPLASGVPMLRSTAKVLPVARPAAWKTLPVTWSMAG